MHITPVMYSDPSGKFFITSLVIAAVGTIIYAGMYTAIDGMLEESKTAKEFGYEKWELVGYALSGSVAGIYWELQLHYAFYKSPMNWFFPNGREAWIDYNPSVGEPVSRFSEWLGRIFG